MWMMMRTLLLTVMLLCFVPSANADSVAASNAEDAQCIILGARLLRSENPQYRKSGRMLVVYFLGRINGRTPHADLAAMIEKEATRMTEAAFKGAMSRCGAELSAGGAELAQIGMLLQSNRK